jgi:hypothetical protein
MNAPVRFDASGRLWRDALRMDEDAFDERGRRRDDMHRALALVHAKTRRVASAPPRDDEVHRLRAELACAREQARVLAKHTRILGAALRVVSESRPRHVDGASACC